MGAGILPGDLVVVHRQQDAYNGEIVVALFEDEATVKTLSRRGGHTWLLPENPDYDPIDGRPRRHHRQGGGGGPAVLKFQRRQARSPVRRKSAADKTRSVPTVAAAQPVTRAGTPSSSGLTTGSTP